MVDLSVLSDPNGEQQDHTSDSSIEYSIVSIMASSSSSPPTQSCVSSRFSSRSGNRTAGRPSLAPDTSWWSLSTGITILLLLRGVLSRTNPILAKDGDKSVAVYYLNPATRSLITIVPVFAIVPVVVIHSFGVFATRRSKMRMGPSSSSEDEGEDLGQCQLQVIIPSIEAVHSSWGLAFRI